MNCSSNYGDVRQELHSFSFQIFPEHDELSDRYNKTLYYGKLPVTDRASLPLTQLAVDQFTSVGLDALGRKLGRLDVSRAAEMTRTACVGPSSLVLALLYLDRLRYNSLNIGWCCNGRAFILLFIYSLKYIEVSFRFSSEILKLSIP